MPFSFSVELKQLQSKFPKTQKETKMLQMHCSRNNYIISQQNDQSSTLELQYKSYHLTTYFKISQSYCKKLQSKNNVEMLNGPIASFPILCIQIIILCTPAVTYRLHSCMKIEPLHVHETNSTAISKSEHKTIDKLREKFQSPTMEQITTQI